MRVASSQIEVKGAASTEVEGVKEVIVATLNGVTTDTGHQAIRLSATTYWEAAATAENMIIRIRRGATTAGTEVEKVEIASVASKKNECSIQATDTPGEVAEQSYILTMEETKAAAKDKALAPKLSASW